MNDQEIEQAIQEKGLNAPRITPARIAELMSRIVYTFDVRPNGSTTTLAHAFLDGNFYLATGVSACVSVENFDAELGKDIASTNAKVAAEDKLWELEGYALRERLRDGDTTLAPHQQRVVAEKAELDAKLEKLSAFISSDGFLTVVADEEERGRLICQEEVMKQYSEILGERIAAFKKTD